MDLKLSDCSATPDLERRQVDVDEAERCHEEGGFETELSKWALEQPRLCQLVADELMRGERHDEKQPGGEFK